MLGYVMSKVKFVVKVTNVVDAFVVLFFMFCKNKDIYLFWLHQ